MANTGVSGRFVYTGTTNGIAGLVIQVVDIDWITSEQTLGWGATGIDGRFSITYPASRYGALEWQPDIVVRAYDLYGRLLHETAEQSNVTVTTLTLPDISLHPGNVSGWLVTNALINPAGTPVMLSAGNAIEFLIENEGGWREITDGVAAAASSVNFMILYLEVPSVVTKFTRTPTEGTAVAGEKIQDRLREAATARGIPVRVLANDFSPDLFGTLDTATEITDFFRGSPVQVRLYSTTPLSPMHAKLLILDGSTAYLIGSPIMQEYWDSPTHTIEDPRRGAMGISNAIKVPIHEVNIRVRGPAVGDVDRTFTVIWNQLAPAGSNSLTPVSGQAAQSGANVAACQVVRTLPGNRFTGINTGETGILEAYQRAIANAEDFIYIEDQYFTSPELADAIVKRLSHNTSVQAILLFNIKVDIPGYSGLQPRMIRQLQDGAQRAGVQDRLGIFTTWSHEAGTPTRIMRNYIHSKTAIVDGKWATVGSANTDGTSMNQTQVFNELLTGLAQTGSPTQHANPNRPAQPYRAVELNLAIYNNVAGQPTTPIIDDLRQRLWQEHLGYATPADAALTTRPAAGWLSLWRDRATLKLDGLKLSAPAIREPRVLEWTTQDDASAYLQALGVDVTRLHVLTEVRSFNFATGQWARS